MRCCHPTRREFLRWAALVAATPLLPWEGRAYAQASVALPINLELVTLTETTAIITWFTGDPTAPDDMGRLAPVAADTEVLLGTSPGNLKVVHHDATATAYHYVELTGLEPDTDYFYVARSGGVPAAPAVSVYGNPVGTSSLPLNPSGPFAFRTPNPPPGRHLFTVALCADMHIGETVAGLATTQAGVGVPPGITQVEGRPPYAEVMAAALAPEIRQRGAQLLIAAGDVTSGAEPAEVATSRRYLDAFGTYRRDYLVTRGNHDRRGVSDDPFAATYFPSQPTWFSQEAFGMRFVGLDTYDKLGSGGDNGALSDTQWAFVREELAREKDRPTLVIGHHPVTIEGTVTTVPPLIFGLDQTQAHDLEALYAATPGVFLHQAGHTHRNKKTLSPNAPGVVFQETSAVKEYPGGFTLLRVHTGGYALNFYKFKAPLAQEWSERSRPEYLGLAPFYYFGTPTDRNAVVTRDFTGLSATRGPLPAAPVVQRRSELAATGGPGAVATGAVALGAAIAMRRMRG